MDRSTVEKHLLASSRDYWATFKLRLDGYYVWERRIAAKALIDCAGTLSRRFGHTPDDYLYGGHSLTAREVNDLFARLRLLHDHAYGQDFHQGVTAIYAMKAIGTLLLARHVTDRQLIRDTANEQLEQYREVISTLIQAYRDATAQA